MDIKNYTFLKKMLKNAYPINIKDYPSIVIFSDLHMGSGGRRDEFKQSSNIFIESLKEYYYPKGYTLILNGDIEELHKYSYKKITNKWKEVYNEFNKFQQDHRLFKIIGNHDDKIANFMHLNKPYPLYDSITISGFERDLYVYHGHQSMIRYIENNQRNELFVKYIAKPFYPMHWQDSY